MTSFVTGADSGSDFAHVRTEASVLKVGYTELSL